MMSRDTLLIRFAAIVTTLAEVGSPESMLYILCDMNMDDYAVLRGLLVNGGYVDIKGHYVTLTPKGHTFAGQINAATKG